jgi:hypothetical protein
MDTNVFTTRQLVAIVDDLRIPRTFLLDTFFPNVHNSDTEVLDFDIITKGRKLAPFVSPLVAGKPVKGRGQVTKTFKPAYVKPKDSVKPNTPLKRRPGERYAGDMTPQQRHDQIVMDMMEDQKASITRRKEWMAAQAFDTGKVVVEGEDYPKVEVDFGRDESLTKQLLLAARWGEENVSVLDDLETWAGEVQTLSGAAPTDVVLDPKAWKLARKDANFKEVLDNRRGTTGQVELGPLSIPVTGARYVGNTGDFDFWVYQETYEDDDGNPAQLMPDNTVWLGSAGVEGVQAHGAILDPRAGYAALEYYPTNWISDDPAIEWLMLQSAPLVIPSRVNATARIRVR